MSQSNRNITLISYILRLSIILRRVTTFHSVLYIFQKIPWQCQNFSVVLYQRKFYIILSIDSTCRLDIQKQTANFLLQPTTNRVSCHIHLSGPRVIKLFSYHNRNYSIDNSCWNRLSRCKAFILKIRTLILILSNPVLLTFLSKLIL